MKNVNTLISALFLIVLIGFIGTAFVNEKEGQTPVILDTNEEVAAPTLDPEVAAHIASKEDLIVLESPKPNEIVHSPMVLSGKARGTWYFEASFPIVVVDWDGKIIGEGYATADGDWMTEDFVPFTAMISYELPADTPYDRGAIILKKDNPSGLPEFDDALEIPIFFGTDAVSVIDNAEGYGG